MATTSLPYHPAFWRKIRYQLFNSNSSDVLGSSLSWAYAIGLGFFSFVGSYTLFPSTIVAIISGIFTCAVVGDVWSHDVKAAIRKLLGLFGSDQERDKRIIHSLVRHRVQRHLSYTLTKMQLNALGKLNDDKSQLSKKTLAVLLQSGYISERKKTEYLKLCQRLQQGDTKTIENDTELKKKYLNLHQHLIACRKYAVQILNAHLKEHHDDDKIGNAQFAHYQSLRAQLAKLQEAAIEAAAYRKDNLQKLEQRIKQLKLEIDQLLTKWSNDYKQRVENSIFSNNDKALIADAIARRKWAIGLGMLMTGLVSACLFLATIDAISGALLVLGIAAGGASLAFPIVALSIVITVSYAMIIYHTITDIIGNDTVRSYRQRFQAYTQQQSPTKKILLYIGAALILLVMLAATVLTFGGWWYAAKAGLQFFPRIKNKVAQFFVNAGLLCATISYSITDFSINIKKSFESLRVLVTHFTNPIKHAIHEFKQELNRDGVATIIPRLLMRLISVPAKLLLFIAHNVSEGLTFVKESGDQIKTLVAASVADALTESSVVLGHRHEHEHEKPKLLHRQQIVKKSSCSDSKSRRNDSDVIIDVKATQKLDAKDEVRIDIHQLHADEKADPENNEEHEHGIIDFFVSLLLPIALAPLHILDITLDYFFGKQKRSFWEAVIHSVRLIHDDEYDGEPCQHKPTVKVDDAKSVKHHDKNSSKHHHNGCKHSGPTPTSSSRHRRSSSKSHDAKIQSDVVASTAQARTDIDISHDLAFLAQSPRTLRAYPSGSQTPRPNRECHQTKFSAYPPYKSCPPSPRHRKSP